MLTAGPGLGGEKFTTAAATGLSLASHAVVWRTLCIAAMLVSLVAAISTNLSRSHETASRITVAEAVNAELEGLATLLQFGQLSLPDAVKLYQQYVARIPFVEELEALPLRLDSPHPSIPAGWYPADPRQPEVVRWWDGRNWTEHTRMPTYDQGPPPDPPRGADAQLTGRRPTADYRPPAPPGA